MSYWGSSCDVTLGAATSATTVSRYLPGNILIKKYKLTSHETLFCLIDFVSVYLCLLDVFKHFFLVLMHKIPILAELSFGFVYMTRQRGREADASGERQFKRYKEDIKKIS